MTTKNQHNALMAIWDDEYSDGEGNTYTDTAAESIMWKLNYNAQQAGGMLTSLANEGYIYMDSEYVDMTEKGRAAIADYI